MREQEKSQFALLITSVGEMYDKSLNQFLIELYWNVLKTFEFSEIKLGISRHMKNPDVGMFLPKPANIIAAIDGDTKVQALQAWTKVIDAMKRIGVYESLVFDDAIIHAVIRDMGGWQKICMTNVENLPFIANEFQTRYRTFLNQKPIHYPRYLIGIAESQNSIAGFGFAAPKLFGDKAKARKILSAESDDDSAKVRIGFNTNSSVNNESYRLALPNNFLSEKKLCRKNNGS